MPYITTAPFRAVAIDYLCLFEGLGGCANCIDLRIYSAIELLLVISLFFYYYYPSVRSRKRG